MCWPHLHAMLTLHVIHVSLLAAAGFLDPRNRLPVVVGRGMCFTSKGLEDGRADCSWDHGLLAEGKGTS